MKNPTNARYWAEYNGLQHAKHQLLRKYLGGWFPILGSWSGKVLYIDCHAGRGRHKPGQEGSPILALRVFLEHSHRKRILDDTEVHFIFCEIGEDNYKYLCQEVEKLGDIPDNIIIAPHQKDYEAFLRENITKLRNQGQQLAPSFAFVDPYGFTIPMDLMNAFLDFSACELFINFMYRYVDMAIHNETQEENMNQLFGCNDWTKLVEIKDSQVRAEGIIHLYAQQLKAEYVTPMYMKGENNALKYVLIHATNNKKGRELMKDSIWKITPDGSFTAYERNRPEQLILIQPEPDLSPLEDSIWRDFAGKEVFVNEMYDWLISELFCKSHLHQLLRCYRNSGVIKASKFGKKFAFRRNPLFSFPKQKPEI